MASSAQEPSSYGTTAAPPPTPSAPTNHHSSRATSDATADAFSRLLLNRLLTSPPSLSLPSRLSPPKSTVVFPPKLSLPLEKKDHLAGISELAGFFQLSGHSIPSDLAKSAELESLSLFDLPSKEKQQIFSNKTTWPLGYDDGEDEAGRGESFCLDDSCFSESTRLSLVSLRELTRALERLGSQIVESVFEKGASGSCCSLMWVCRGGGGGGDNKTVFSGRFYPYVVALEYQIRRQQEWSLLGDSGWVCVSPEVDLVLVTIGDIAQVWSNGKLTKVRGKQPVVAVNVGDEDGTGRCITMSLLMTLPTDSNVSASPLLLKTSIISDDQDNKNNDDDNNNNHRDGERRAVFNTFSFEDYAWRVYHERFPFKDPLDRHRT